MKYKIDSEIQAIVNQTIINSVLNNQTSTLRNKKIEDQLKLLMNIILVNVHTVVSKCFVNAFQQLMSCA